MNILASNKIKFNTNQSRGFNMFVKIRRQTRPNWRQLDQELMKNGQKPLGPGIMRENEHRWYWKSKKQVEELRNQGHIVYRTQEELHKYYRDPNQFIDSKYRNVE